MTPGGSAATAVSTSFDLASGAVIGHGANIVGGADIMLFHLTNPNDGPGFMELQFKRAPDFETPRDHDGDNYYELSVQIDDALVDYLIAVSDIEFA